MLEPDESTSRNNPHTEKVVREIAGVLKELEPYLEAARKEGYWLDERELLTCPCGFIEDVASDGKLITYKEGEAVVDSGLRFLELPDDSFQCPCCAEQLTTNE